MIEVEDEDGGLLGYCSGKLDGLFDELATLSRELERRERDIFLAVERPGPDRVVVRVYRRRGIGALTPAEYEEHLRASLEAAYAEPPGFELSDAEYAELRQEFGDKERDEWVELELGRRDESPTLVREFRRGTGRVEYDLPIRSGREWVLGF